MADREGRLLDRPARIRGLIFPYRESIDVDGMLGWLAVHNFIHRYAACGLKLIQVLTFWRHQHPHKNEPPSELPKLDQSVGQKPANGGLEALPKSAVTPADSGLRTPDSGLRTPDCLNTASPPLAGPQHIRDSEADIRRHIDAIKAIYPKAARQDWITAEKLIRNLVTSGTNWADLTEGIRRYARLCVATNRAAQNPGAFFQAVDSPWLQEWPLPTLQAHRPAPARDNSAAWAELEAKARDIGARPRSPMDTLESYRTEIMLAQRPKQGGVHPGLSALTNKLRRFT